MAGTQRPSRLETAERFLTRWAHDPEGAMAELEDDVVYRVPGSSSLAGTFRGRQEVIEHLRLLMERTHGTQDVIKVEDWLVGDTHIAALIRTHMQARGQRYDSHHLFVFSFGKSGKIAELRVFFNDERQVRELLGT